jgi:class 3 adenylate cyclase
MPALSFRTKLLLAMMLVVIGISGSILYVSQKNFQEHYRELYAKLFQVQINSFSTNQKTLVDNIKQTCATLVGSTRLQFAMLAAIGGDADNLYRAAKGELQTRRMLASDAGDSNAFQATFYLFLGTNGLAVPPPESLAEMQEITNQEDLKRQLEQAGLAIAKMEPQAVSYITPQAQDGGMELQQAILTRVIDTSSDEILGALVLGFPLPDLGEGSSTNYPFRAGILFEDRIYSKSISESGRKMLAARITQQLKVSEQPPDDFIETIDGDPHRIFYQALNPDPHLPKAYLVALISIKESLAKERDLRGKIFFFGGLGLIGALGMSLLLSHGLSVPIRELVRGTNEIQRGNFEVKVPVRSRDEIGRLATSFNNMAEGLVLKEKYRSVLDKVSDQAVAQELMQGNVALGGETREISVLFCDIRGFTALSQGMNPDEVIRMLNEHFTPLTRVVKEHNGVVDKFVGDLIMAIFGAPKSYGDDAYNAARCALDMIHERQKLNETSSYRIQIGIGVASGAAVAGCMGSADRLNYTVLGERVNLASRLCGKADRMEVVIDQTTRERLGEAGQVEILPELLLKGFSAPVSAYKLVEIRTVQEVL